VVLEGADGSGKTAIAAAVCGELRARGQAVVPVSRVNPSGRSAYARVVADIAQIFRASDEAGSPLPLLALGAALQHATMFENQVRPALDDGACVIADSWWTKTRVRFAVEARRCTDWRPEDHQRFDRWLAGLFRYAYAGREAEVVTVLIDTSKEDRVRWYSRLREKQAVYDRRGATTKDPAEFGDFTEEIQQQLRVIATQSRWPLVENRDGKDPLTTAREILAVAAGTPGMRVRTGWPR
jgi:hypothetical protein